jgi:hypothetical protein
MSSGAPRWRMPLALLLSVLAHLLALAGIEARLGVADREPPPQTVTIELLPPPPPLAAAPQPAAPARSSPPEVSPTARGAPPRPRLPRRPRSAAAPPAQSAATVAEAVPSTGLEPRLVDAAPGSGPAATDPFPVLTQLGADPMAETASTAPDRAPGGGAAAGTSEGESARRSASGSAAAGEGGTSGTGEVADRTAGSAAADARCAAAGEAATPAAALLSAVPFGGRWVYDVFFGEYTEMRTIAQVEYRLRFEGDRYAMHSEGSARGLTALFYSGLITQSSSGRIGTDGVQPERYVERRGKRAPRTVEVDRAHCEVVFADSTRRPLPEGAQDRLSSLLQLALLARSAPSSFEAGRQVDLPEFTNSSVQIARYRSEGAQRLETGNGPLHTLHLVRLKQGGAEEPTIEIWLGYDHAMLPVRIRVTEYNGRVFDQLLSKAAG